MLSQNRLVALRTRNHFSTCNRALIKVIRPERQRLRKIDLVFLYRILKPRYCMDRQNCKIKCSLNFCF